MLKIGQNWGKIANYPPNAQQRLAPLSQTINKFTQLDAYPLPLMQDVVKNVAHYKYCL